MAKPDRYECRLTANAPYVLYFPDNVDIVGRTVEVSNNTKYFYGTSGTATFWLTWSQYDLAMAGPSGQFIQVVSLGTGTAGITGDSVPVAVVKKTVP